MFEKYFNRKYEPDDFPYFVPKQEREYNLEFAATMIKDGWVRYRWEEAIGRNGWKRNKKVSEKIIA